MYAHHHHHQLTLLFALKNSGSSSKTTGLSSLDDEEFSSLSLSGEFSTGFTTTGGILSKSPSLVIITSSVSVLSSVEELGFRGTTATLSTERSGIFQCFPLKSLTPPKNQEVKPTGSFVRMPSDDEEEAVDIFLTVTALGDDLATFISLGTEFTLLDSEVEGEDDCLEDEVDTRFEEAVDAFFLFFLMGNSSLTDDDTLGSY